MWEWRKRLQFFCSFSFDDDAMHVHEPLEVGVEVLLVPVES